MIAEPPRPCRITSGDSSGRIASASAMVALRWSRVSCSPPAPAPSGCPASLAIVRTFREPPSLSRRRLRQRLSRQIAVSAVVFFKQIPVFLPLGLANSAKRREVWRYPWRSATVDQASPCLWRPETTGEQDNGKGTGPALAGPGESAGPPDPAQ